MGDPTNLNEISISRRILTEDDLEIHRTYPIKTSIQKKFTQKLKKTFTCNQKNFLRKFEFFFPIVFWLRTYGWKSDFKGDLVSGLTVGVMQISQGLYL